MKIKEIIALLPQDTQQKVEDAKKQFNQIIREAIRQETRFRLLSKDENTFNENTGAIQRIKISTTVGYPKELDEFTIPEEFRIAAFLSQIKHDLIKLKESAHEVTEFIIGFQDYHEILEFVGGNICYAEGEASKLIKLTKKYDLVKQLLKINPNILGSYSYNTDFRFFENKRFHADNISVPAEIKLYWAVIGIVSGNIGVDVASLTAVVLSHELAHAYTHLGRDIDGNRWNDESFFYTDLSIKEGLAQYYTEKVAEKLRNRFPNILPAYERLLEKQSKEYQIHKNWIENMNIKPEIIRATLVNRRTGSPISINEFEQLLQDTKLFSDKKRR